LPNSLDQQVPYSTAIALDRIDAALGRVLAFRDGLSHELIAFLTLRHSASSTEHTVDSCLPAGTIPLPPTSSGGAAIVGLLALASNFDRRTARVGPWKSRSAKRFLPIKS
jgi:hypothetical protein